MNSIRPSDRPWNGLTHTVCILLVACCATAELILLIHGLANASHLLRVLFSATRPQLRPIQAFLIPASAAAGGSHSHRSENAARSAAHVKQQVRLAMVGGDLRPLHASHALVAHVPPAATASHLKDILGKLSFIWRNVQTSSVDLSAPIALYSKDARDM